jgi:hypothetical protein
MQAINPLELVSEAVAEVQKRFYKDFPPHADEAKYNYKTPSTMKVTRTYMILIHKTIVLLYRLLARAACSMHPR